MDALARRDQVRMLVDGLTAANDLGLTTAVTVQELLGHADVTSTMIYTPVLNRGGLGVKSPIDRI